MLFLPDLVLLALVEPDSPWPLLLPHLVLGLVPGLAPDLVPEFVPDFVLLALQLSLDDVHHII